LVVGYEALCPDLPTYSLTWSAYFQLHRYLLELHVFTLREPLITPFLSLVNRVAIDGAAGNHS